MVLLHSRVPWVFCKLIIDVNFLLSVALVYLMTIVVYFKTYTVKIATNSWLFILGVQTVQSATFGDDVISG